MPEDTQAPADDATAEAAPAKAAAKKTAKKVAAKTATAKKTAEKTAAKKTTKKAAAKKSAATKAAEPIDQPITAPVDQPVVQAADPAPGAAEETPAPGKRTAAKRTRKTAEPAPVESDSGDSGAAVLFQAPEPTPAKRTRARKTAKSAEAPAAEPAESADSGQASREPQERDDSAETAEDGEGSPARRRRRRGGRRRRKPGDGDNSGADGEGAEGAEDAEESAADAETQTDADEPGGESSSRRRRRRRRTGDDGGDTGEDPEKTVTRVRRTRSAEDQITAVSGSTRLEAKKQRRREGREAGRRRAPIVSEAEFLARRESVERVMVIRQRDDLTQIGVLEDKVLVEHYATRESQTSLIGNVYLGRVQNVLPSMEAAFVDIGRGRNAVLYAGEVNWSSLGHKDGQPRKIESVLSSGQAILVQVTKDPIGHKGARLTSQISLAGRFLVYVPDGTTSGISRKLPDTERNRLKTLLREIVPDTAGVIVRTAAEGASEDELTHDVERLKARWEDIEKKTKGSAPQLLYGEPDLTLKVVRDLFTEDFTKLVIQGDDAWETVQQYVTHVAPDLEPRLERYDASEHSGNDLFSAYRVDEQIAKALDRKVWLPSGGSLVIDRTEAMTVVDVNTGKFTGSGGNLEETVTKNNLEAAEEVVRQLRLRDIGGIIVVDFIDMVLESNRDLVLRRLVECLGRDRTRHQVAEVTSLGLVQMTRKRIGTGLLEAFSETCEHCGGRGLIIHDQPVEARRGDDDGGRRPAAGRRSRGGRGRGGEENGSNGSNGQSAPKPPTPKDIAAMARQHEHDEQQPDEAQQDELEQDELEQARPGQDDEVELPDQDTPEESDDADELESLDALEVEAEVEAEAEVVEDALEEQAEEEIVPELPAEPERPVVVTRTRRRAASRPAGPPATLLVEDSVVEVDGIADADPHDDAEPAAAVGHVPIKRRGARKR